MKKKILVLTDHMPWGHRSIAKAIYNYLKDTCSEDFEVYFAQIESEAGIANDVYQFFYRYYPAINRLNNKIISSKIGFEILKEGSIKNLHRLKKEINKIKPDLIISAYFFHSHSLQYWREKEKKKFKLWTVVADPWTINPISFVKGVDLHLVYDETAEKLARNNGIKKETILKTNWWVRPDMYKSYNKDEAKKKLGLEGNYPVIFVGGGSLGTSALPKILPLLMLAKSKVGIIFNTGTDKLSFALVEEYEKLFKKIKQNNNVVIKNLGWIDNMAEVLSACDIVFGKAGPNFLFDTVAVEKPFVAITHIGGQEDGNIDLILEKKLGWIKEKKDDLSEFFIKYLENPEKYNTRYSKHIHKEAMKNQGSLELIRKEVLKVLA